MAGPPRRFGRGERGQTQSLPQTSHDLLTPAQAAPSCVSEIEVPGSAEPSRHGARQIARQTIVGRSSFRYLQSGSMTIAEDSQNPCPPRLARPASGESSRHIVSTRIDRQSSRLRSPNSETAKKSRSTDLHDDLAHMARAPPSC
jgi:hypothetical protein